MNTTSFKKLWNWYPIDFHKKNWYPELVKQLYILANVIKLFSAITFTSCFFLFVCFSWSSLWKVIQCMSLSRFFWEDRMTTLSHIFRVCSVLSLWSKYFVQATHFRRGHFNANSRCIYFNTVWISKQTWCFVKKSCQLFSYLKRVFVQGNKTLFFYWPSVEIVYLHVVFVFCTGQT